MARKVQEDDYVTEHVEQDCQCASLSPILGDINKALKAGLIPRLKITEDPYSFIGVHLDVSTSGPYVAISHVWSDGLGNPKANSLPVCQIRQLNTLTEGIPNKGSGEVVGSSSLGIWIDTLCIPVEREGRTLAIGRLADTFKSAAKVLILDREMLSLPSSVAVEELLARFQFSGWMQRLWTLEEGILGLKNLHLQPADRAINIIDILLKPPISLDNAIVDNASLCIERSLPHMRLYDPDEETMEMYLFRTMITTETRVAKPNLHSLGEALRYRMSSKPADEALCIASIMSLDVADIIAHHQPKDRMRAIYTHMWKMSASAIALGGPKPSITGFRCTFYLDAEKPKMF
jgi:hypothetical protein